MFEDVYPAFVYVVMGGLYVLTCQILYVALKKLEKY
jgi:hypothetical protein